MREGPDMDNARQIFEIFHLDHRSSAGLYVERLAA